MTVSLPGKGRLCAAGLCLLAASFVPTVVHAQAQINPQELLKQVLPGASKDSDSDDVEAAGERACQRYAEKQGLDVRRVRDVQRSGKNNLKITLSVEDRDDRYDALCDYDTGDREVRNFAALNGDERNADRNGEVDERLARRAQDACEQLAEDRDLNDVDVGTAKARGRDTVEIQLRARVHGQRQSFSCLYDADQRHAVLAE